LRTCSRIWVESAWTAKHPDGHANGGVERRTSIRTHEGRSKFYSATFFCTASRFPLAQNALEKPHLSHVECLGKTVRRSALHTAQAGKPAERIGVEPILRSLAAEMRLQQIDLACQNLT